MRFILRPLAQFLVRQKITLSPEEKYAGPPFRLYQFPERGKLQDFRKLMDEVVLLYEGNEKLKFQQVREIVYSLIDLERL